MDFYLYSLTGCTFKFSVQHSVPLRRAKRKSPDFHIKTKHNKNAQMMRFGWRDFFQSHLLVSWDLQSQFVSLHIKVRITNAKNTRTGIANCYADRWFPETN